VDEGLESEWAVVVDMGDFADVYRPTMHDGTLDAPADGAPGVEEEDEFDGTRAHARSTR
jgi:hypothetical protein